MTPYKPHTGLCNTFKVYQHRTVTQSLSVTREITIKHTFKPTYNLFTLSAWLTPCTPNLCNRLCIYTYGMAVGPAWGVNIPKA